MPFLHQCISLISPVGDATGLVQAFAPADTARKPRKQTVKSIYLSLHAAIYSHRQTNYVTA